MMLTFLISQKLLRIAQDISVITQSKTESLLMSATAKVAHVVVSFCQQIFGVMFCGLIPTDQSRPYRKARIAFASGF